MTYIVSQMCDADADGIMTENANEKYSYFHKWHFLFPNFVFPIESILVIGINDNV
jgi:hypothetical protein